VLCSSGNCYSCHTCLSVCPTLWADTCHGLHRCLLSCWFDLGMHSFDIACVYDLLLCALLQSRWPNYAGHERESSRHSIEADLLRNEPAYIPTDMGFYSGCHLMYHYPNELLEQGILFFESEIKVFPVFLD